MVDLNRVFLVGNLTRDPELRYTPQGIPVVNLRIAVNHRFKGRDGEQREETCFVTVVVWDKMAEICNQYLQKGRQIFVEGRLQSRSWQDNEGKNRNVIEVRAIRVQFMPSFSREQQEEVNLGKEPEEEVLELEKENLGKAI